MSNSLSDANRSWQPLTPTLGSALVSSAGFGVSPKQSFKKVREAGTASPALETSALPRIMPVTVCGLTSRAELDQFFFENVGLWRRFGCVAARYPIELKIVESPVVPGLFQKLRVSANLFHFTLVHDYDLVG